MSADSYPERDKELQRDIMQTKSSVHLDPLIETEREALYILGFSDVPSKRKIIQQKYEEILRKKNLFPKKTAEGRPLTPEEMKQVERRIRQNILNARNLLLNVCPQKGNAKQRHDHILEKYIFPRLRKG